MLTDEQKNIINSHFIDNLVDICQNDRKILRDLCQDVSARWSIEEQIEGLGYSKTKALVMLLGFNPYTGEVPIQKTLEDKPDKMLKPFLNGDLLNCEKNVKKQ